MRAILSVVLQRQTLGFNRSSIVVCFSGAWKLSLFSSWFSSSQPMGCCISSSTFVSDRCGAGDNHSVLGWVASRWSFRGLGEPRLIWDSGSVFIPLLRQGSWWLGLLCWDVGGLEASAAIGVAAHLVFKDWARKGWVRDWEGSDPIHVNRCRPSLLSPIWPRSVPIHVGHSTVRSSRDFPTFLRRGFLCRKWVRSSMWPVLGNGTVVGCWFVQRLLLAALSVIGCCGFQAWDPGGGRI